MKKTFLIGILLALVLVACVVLVACNPQGGGSVDEKPNEYETAKYTVTFDTKNPQFVLVNSVIKDVEYGTKISAPKDENGNMIVPVKRGYDFKFWSKDGANEFDFVNTPITSNITLSAVYVAKNYVHNVDLNAKLVVEGDGNGGYTYRIERDARPKGEIVIGSEDLDSTRTSIKSQYNATNSLNAPSAADGVNKFCFWYYMDDDGKPVQFTKWKNSGESAVLMLSKYEFTKSLTLYPMFEDNLPNVNVIYRDSLTEAIYNQTRCYSFGKTVPLAEQASAGLKVGYVFDYWYYEVETKDGEGNVIKTPEKFVFYEPAIGEEKEIAGTVLSEAAGAKDNFTPVKLYLYAKWTRNVTLSSKADFDALYGELKVENPTEDEIKRIEELLLAKITITANIDLAGETYEPLFDKAHAFAGELDGGGFVISNGRFESETHASVFGYNAGKIENVKIANSVSYAISQNGDGEYANVVYIGGLVTENKGYIGKVEVNMGSGSIVLAPLHTAYIGGVAASSFTVDRGDKTGIVEEAAVDISGFACVANSACFKGLVLGGIVAENGSGACIRNSSATVSADSIICKDDGVAYTGRTFLKAGGVVGVNGGLLVRNVATFDVAELDCVYELSLGGIVGENSGRLEKSSASLSVCSAGAASVGGSKLGAVAVGGLIGKNEGSLVDCYANLDVSLAVLNEPSGGTNVVVGGVVGNNSSSKRDATTSPTTGVGAINFCYALGNIKIAVADGAEDTTVYAGGIIGRNNKSKLDSFFAAVNIDVTNKDGVNKLGYLVGSMDKYLDGEQLKDCTIKDNVFYSSDMTIKLGGVTYVAPQEGETAVFDVLALGKAEAADSLKNAVFVLGEGGVSQLKFSGNSWVMDTEGDGYPIIKPAA